MPDNEHRGQSGDAFGDGRGRSLLPGLRLVKHRAKDEYGEVWLGQEAGGELVDVRRVPGTVAALDRDAAREQAAVFAAVAHPHLAPVRRMMTMPDELVLVSEPSPRGCLAELLPARRRLAAGEVVTIAAPVADALATLHAAGLAAGAVSAATIRFTADGRPLLADAGLPRIAPLGRSAPHAAGAEAPGGGGTPEADVHDLAAVCWWMLRGEPPPSDGGAAATEWPATAPAGLRAILEAARSPDAAERPTAAELSAALLGAATPVPVRLGPAVGTSGPVPDGPPPSARPRSFSGARPLSGSLRDAPTSRRPRSGRGAHRPDPPSERRRAPRRGTPSPRAGSAPGRPRRGAAVALRVAVGLGVGSAVALTAALVGPGLPGPPSVSVTRPPPSPAAAPDVPGAGEVAGKPSPPAPSTAGAPDPDDWRQVLSALDQRRTVAFATGNPAVLAEVYAPSSPALRRDGAMLERLRAVGARTSGLRLDVVSLRPLRVEPRQAVLLVRDRRPGYVLIERSGRRLSRPARGPASWRVTLVRVGDDWRMYDVTRARAP